MTSGGTLLRVLQALDPAPARRPPPAAARAATAPPSTTHAGPPSAELGSWCDALVADATEMARNLRVQLVDAECEAVLWTPAAWEVPCDLRMDPSTGDEGAAAHQGGAGLPPFYCSWRPAASDALSTDGRSPAIIRTPGYSSGFVPPSAALSQAGYAQFHVNPLGLGTPAGNDLSKRQPISEPVKARLQADSIGGAYANLDEGVPPHLMRTARGVAGGYRDWLVCGVAAVLWLARHCPAIDPLRLGMAGGSQGGGASLLLASLLQGTPPAVHCAGLTVRAVAADQPFMTNWPMMLEVGDQRHPAMAELAHVMEQRRSDGPAELEKAWAALGLVDTVSHAHRLTGLPTLLTAGGEDGTCPFPCVQVRSHGLQLHSLWRIPTAATSQHVSVRPGAVRAVGGGEGIRGGAWARA